MGKLINSEQTIETELRLERPKWIISSFGAAKYEPCLFFGDELSPEELRWKSVQALKAGQPQQYVSTSLPRRIMPDSVGCRGTTITTTRSEYDKSSAIKSEDE
jgi:hypothetical protein